MGNLPIWEGVRDLVRCGELTAAIEVLEGWLKGRLDGPNRDTVRDWLDELLLHFASTKSVQIGARKGVMTKEEEGVELRQISKSVLALVREVEREDLSVAAIQVPVMNVPRQYEEGKFEKIIGNRSRLQMVSWLEQGLKCSSGVCRLVSGRCIGTGFRIDRDLLVTNNHVIASAEAAQGFTAQFFFEERPDRTMRDAVMVQLDANRFWTSEQLDVTIVGARLDGVAANRTIAALNLKNSAGVQVGDAVAIIQHPLGGPKQIALTANEVINIYEHRIQYVTDTLPGSSGAPVFDVFWDVIAVHHAGGNLLRNARGDAVFANEGISVPAFTVMPEAKRLIATA
jgi:V8-like Glu-specific endopeptidase